MMEKRQPKDRRPNKQPNKPLQLLRPHAKTTEKKKDTCSICLEEFESRSLAKPACKHKCCSTCLTELFKSATTDESRYPAKCCNPIPLDTVRRFINSKVASEYEKKQAEWETQNRTYCSDKDCGKFISTSNIFATWADCPHCLRVTCTECKNVAHGDKDCPVDKATEQALKLMEKKNYKRCWMCKSGVELMQGCNNLT